MKRKAYIVLALVLLVSAFLSISAAADAIRVQINGEDVLFDTPPQIINGRTMVPMRKIFEELGATVIWDDETKTATAQRNEVTVNVTANSPVLFKNSMPYLLDMPPILREGRMLIPLRTVVQAFGCMVDFDHYKYLVSVTASENEAVKKEKYTPEEIAQMVCPAVCFIETFDEHDMSIGTGSGFFISPDGIVVTNYHVAAGSFKTNVETIDGEIYNVTEIISFDKVQDIAVLKISPEAVSGKVTGAFPFLNLADSDLIKTGQTIYTVGSPQQLKNTFTSGIISNTKREEEGAARFQITAPVSPGSSGGAVVNDSGAVVGIVVSSFIYEAQNLNFAIPVNSLKNMSFEDMSMSPLEFGALKPEIKIDVKENVEILTEKEQALEVNIYSTREINEPVLVYNEELYSACLEEYSKLEGHYRYILSFAGRAEGEDELSIRVSTDDTEEVAHIEVYVSKPVYNVYSEKINIPIYSDVTDAILIRSEQTDTHDIYYYPFDVAEFDEYVFRLKENGFIESESETFEAVYNIKIEGMENPFILEYDRDMLEVKVFVPRG